MVGNLVGLNPLIIFKGKKRSYLIKFKIYMFGHKDVISSYLPLKREK